MKTCILTALLGIILVGSRPAIRARASLSAPTYYIAVSARLQDAQHVRFEGASNVPPGAKISINVAKFSGYGWTSYSADNCSSVNDEGLFAGQLTPKPGLEFPRSGDLVVAATFQTNLCRPQATPVLEALGEKGQRLANVKDGDMTELAGLSDNPQIYQVSGWYYGIEAIARVQ